MTRPTRSTGFDTLTEEQREYLKWPTKFWTYGWPKSCPGFMDHPFEGCSDADVLKVAARHRDEIPDDHPLAGFLEDAS